MTICIAAICEGNMLFGLSDRMLTAGDIQFQPQSSKIWSITSSIAMMTAGDLGLQTEIYYEVKNAVDLRIKSEPNNWWNVSEVAEMYRSSYFEIKRRRAEKQILFPLNLDSNSFLYKQSGMHPELVSKIAQELIGFVLPDVAVIIAGNNPNTTSPDTNTPHIYVIENGLLSCRDKVGFACIGIGAAHANSSMMLSEYTPFVSAPKSLLAIYTAKKRSEVAPGVGTHTDNFMMTAKLGTFSEIRDEIVDGVVKIYEDSIKEANQVQNQAEEKLNEHIQKVISPTTAPEQTAANKSE